MSGMVNVTKTSFTAGELDPALLGRGDLGAYANGARRLRNVIVAPTGGVSRRPGLRYVDTVRGPGRLIGFAFNTEQTYLLVVSDGYLDVYQGGSRIQTLATPWTTDRIPQLAWAQSADTLLVTHPDCPPKKIVRTSSGIWTMNDWAFFEEDGVICLPHHKFAEDAVTLTPSAGSGTITLTASAGMFQAGHVGLRFRLKAKQVLITAVASATSATAEVKEGLTDTQATSDWEEQAFSALRGWPASVCFHQGRLVIGGSRDLPGRLWLSQSMDLFNFDLGTGLDDEAIEFSMLSDPVNAIRAVFSGRHLQVFTTEAEYMVSGAPLTPTKIQVIRQTRVGSPNDRLVPPRDVDGATHFISRNGRDLREFLYADVEQAYQSTDLAMIAKHVMNHPLDQDYDGGRRLFHVVMDDGSLGVLTVYRSEKVTAWSVLHTDGRFLAVAVMGGEVHVLVERQGAVFLERFDSALSLDCALTGQQATPATVWSGLGHLEGRSLRVLADGGTLADQVVSGGQITLAQPAAAIQAGLPFTHEIEPLPPMTGSSQAATPGRAVRLVQASFRVLETAALHVDTGRGPLPVPLRRFGSARFGAAPPRFSGDIAVRALGWKHDALQPLWRIRQDSPLPCCVLSVTTQMKFAD
ncbi:hypothetical protein A6A04_01730 [Paramagnetospirillum marisnigri]|uniref:Uncharacterized protein n=1 Tax=Paramagnetospirillum marisnigri TaxID=1285242 RepID=A0A178MNA3_9PROT|nr:hypothetical protein [Paramagnetospirillum marisnigri]OAN50156.1 hypothetical protein A6A04_01730 [Paramagnetospirillum marisnigri]